MQMESEAIDAVAQEQASERGVHAASPRDLPARRNANGKLYSVRTLKRRERRAPMLPQLHGYG